MRKVTRKIQRNAQPQRRTNSSSHAQQPPSGADAMFGSRRLELLRLERKLFPKAGKKERVERALKAVHEFCGSFGSKVDLETVKWIAQDPDILDI